MLVYLMYGLQPVLHWPTDPGACWYLNKMLKKNWEWFYMWGWFSKSSHCSHCLLLLTLHFNLHTIIEESLNKHRTMFLQLHSVNIDSSTSTRNILTLYKITSNILVVLLVSLPRVWPSIGPPWTNRGWWWVVWWNVLKSSTDRSRVVVGSWIKFLKKTGKDFICEAAFARVLTVFTAFCCCWFCTCSVSSLTSSLCIKNSILMNKQYNMSY